MSTWPPGRRELWRQPCPSHTGGPGMHAPIRRPMPDGTTEVRCSFCDRTISDLERLHP